MSRGNTSFLAVSCKRSEKVDLKTPILKYVRSAYGQQRADDAATDLDEVQKLRNDVLVACMGASSEAARDTLARSCVLNKSQWSLDSP